MAKTATRYEAVKQGGPFERAEYTVPTPGPNDVLVHTRVVALNPADWKMIEFGMFVSSWPATLGFDGAGIVEEVGSDVKDFKKGDEVFGHYAAGDPKRAAFQDYALLDQSHVGLKPKGVDWEDVASLPVGFMTAAAAVHEGLEIPLPFWPGSVQEGNHPKCILVLGGASSVGASAIQILRLALPDSTIIATSSSKHHSHVSSLGANVVIDYKSADLLEQIDIATSSFSSNDSGDGGVEAILDAVNAVALQPSLLSLLSKSGTTTASNYPKKLFSEVITSHNLPRSEVPEGISQRQIVGTSILQQPGGENLFRTLSQMITDGRYQMPVPVTKVGTGFDCIGQGLLTLKKGVSGTKLVVALE